MISTKTIYSSLISKGGKEVGRKEEEKERGKNMRRERKRARQARKILFFSCLQKGGKLLRSQQIM